MKRQDYIDNLRWVVVALVVGVHSAITYSHVGSWYYMAPELPSPASRGFLELFETLQQAFFMGLMFLLAGYFVPRSYDRKGFRRFVAERFIRLGIPSLIYMLAIHPLMGFFLLHWWKQDLFHAYRGFLLSGDWIAATGPMWFAVALLGFSLVYALARSLAPAGPTIDPGRWPHARTILTTGMVIAAVAYAIRVYQPIGTNVANMQICFFAQYIVLFAAGTLAARRDWFVTVPRRLGFRLLRVALVGGPLSLIGLATGIRGLHLPLGQLLGGGSWLSAAFALWESLFCVAMCTGLLVLFREKLDFTGPVLSRLSGNSFGVYWLHPPVLIGISLAMAPLAWPPVVKFAVLWVVAFAATWLLVEAVIRRVPLVNRLL